MTMHRHYPVRQTALTVALLAVFAAAAAEDEEVTELTKPESSISAGVGYLFQDNLRFGQYSGVTDEGAYGLLDLSIVKRDDKTGTWTRLDGRNLGLDSRELSFEQRRQGNWGYFLDYNQLPHFSPYTVNTALGGIGTNALINGAVTDPHYDTQLSTERKILTLGLDKALGSSFGVQVQVRNEQKEGQRLWGAETATNMAFLAEPIDFTSNQLDATFKYTGDALQLVGGYYGAVFSNNNAALTITPAPASAFISPEPLSPSNQAHQLFLSGGYSFTPKTRGNFKLSYTKATQDETFVYGVPAGTLLNSMTSPEARVDTTLAQLGITARPLPKLSLLANLRYENREDKTPELPYVTASGTNLTNTVFSRKMTTGKLEAGYQMPMGFRLVGGVDLSNIERNVPDIRIVSYRERTDETAYRLELRRAMSETVNGSVSGIHSTRGGSDYLNNVKGTTTYTTLLAPIIWADRDRDKLRLAIDWTPAELLSFQFVAEDGRDSYSGLPLGPQTGKTQFYSADVAYTLSKWWKAIAWASHSDSQMDQLSRVVNATTVDATGALVPNGTYWGAQLGTKGDSVGLGVTGRVTSAFELGANLQYANDRNSQDMSLVTGTALPGLEEIYYRMTRLQLYGKYAVRKNGGVRVDVIHERRTTNDWTWANFVYPQDGTTVTQDMDSKATFAGVSVYYTTH